jgi:hypothetical protein
VESMARLNDKTKDHTITSTAEIELLTINKTTSGRTGVVGKIKPTVAGTISIYEKDNAGTDTLVSSGAAAANQWTYLKITLPLDTAVLKFTPGTGSGSLQARLAMY